MVSPFITIVDRSIIQNASGARTMGASVRYETSLEMVLTTAALRRNSRYSAEITNDSNSGVYSGGVYHTTCMRRGEVDGDPKSKSLRMDSKCGSIKDQHWEEGWIALSFTEACVFLELDALPHSRRLLQPRESTRLLQSQSSFWFKLRPKLIYNSQARKHAAEQKIQSELTSCSHELQLRCSVSQKQSCFSTRTQEHLPRFLPWTSDLSSLNFSFPISRSNT